MLGQSTPILYHTEANGCIFLAAGVGKVIVFWKSSDRYAYSRYVYQGLQSNYRWILRYIAIETLQLVTSLYKVLKI